MEKLPRLEFVSMDCSCPMAKLTRGTASKSKSSAGINLKPAVELQLVEVGVG